MRPELIDPDFVPSMGIPRRGRPDPTEHLPRVETGRWHFTCAADRDKYMRESYELALKLKDSYAAHTRRTIRAYFRDWATT